MSLINTKIKPFKNQAFKNGEFIDAPRDKCTLSCAINGIHAAFHYLKKNYISGCVMTVPTGW
ncbi:alkyl hydroperoxide reductase protein C [Klebsiella oxytoca]|nr:alkyl hydroperoxide reductase protein C [Klebsiella oxytoca]